MHHEQFTESTNFWLAMTAPGPDFVKTQKQGSEIISPPECILIKASRRAEVR